MSLVIEAPVEARTVGEGRFPAPPPFTSPSLVYGLPLPDPDDDAPALDLLDLPPMVPGLPNTEYINCAALICAIVQQAIVDRDAQWCAGPWFNFYLSLLGWDNATILAAKRVVLTEHFASVRGSKRMWRLAKENA